MSSLEVIFFDFADKCLEIKKFNLINLNIIKEKSLSEAYDILFVLFVRNTYTNYF